MKHEGKRYERYARTKDAARLKLLDLQAAAKAGTLGKTQDAGTFKEAVLRHVAEKKGDVTDATMARLDGIVETHLIPALGSVPLSRLTSEQVSQFFKDLQGKGLSSASILKARNFIFATLEDARVHGRIPVNVATRRLAKPPSLPDTEVQAYDAGERDKILAHAGRDYALFYIAFRTGMRSNELRSLEWADVDLKGKALYLTGKVKTKTSRRSVPLAEQTCDVLRKHQERLLAEGHPRPLVFPNRAGKKDTKDHVRERFKN